ncbi:PfkB family carbohydrate kinase [Cyanobium sp. ATX 6F1]|uniref:PfkB family carbohydrate kinase n=1 Tax=Cyanobium sp. ATX 6F1 TaxID=2823702 RepID=UPI0020CBE3DE|nr:PfkB family carbohydrate kinase [Cyanobium sp. ATX 6F1]
MKPLIKELRLAVLGHVEWVSFVRVPALPRSGDIQHASDLFEQAAGGGAVVAAQMARLAGGARFYTALGRDPLGERCAAELKALGLTLHIAWRDAPTRRAITFIEPGGERTITVFGERLSPCASDDLPWEQLERCDGVFATAGDVEALRRARGARVLAATPRLGLPLIRAAGICLDALVGSASDPGEAYAPGDLEPAPGVYVGTEGARGGFTRPGGRFRAPQPSAVALEGGDGDSYGAGDSFAGGLTTALAAGWSLEDALALGARCGAACIAGRGAYAGQIDGAAAGQLHGRTQA